MKIIKTREQAAKEKLIRIKANYGCKICPCCGENKPSIYYIRKGELNKGIMSGVGYTYSKGLFSSKILHVNQYWCNTCGAKWESDPYEV